MKSPSLSDKTILLYLVTTNKQQHNNLALYSIPKLFLTLFFHILFVFSKVYVPFCRINTCYYKVMAQLLVFLLKSLSE